MAEASQNTAVAQAPNVALLKSPRLEASGVHSPKPIYSMSAVSLSINLSHFFPFAFSKNAMSIALQGFWSINLNCVCFMFTNLGAFISHCA